MKKTNTGPRWLQIVVQWFDVLFIMVLCFLTLLSTMLMRGKVLVGSGAAEARLDYSFSPLTFCIVVIVFGLYGWYMLSHSERELKNLVNDVYGEDKASGNSDNCAKKEDVR